MKSVEARRMSSRKRSLCERFIWRSSGVLIFIAMVSKPSMTECASWHTSVHAWLLRLACATGWALLGWAFAATATVVDSQRITPGTDMPAEIPKHLDIDVNEKPQIDYRVVVGIALFVFIEKLISDRTSLTAPLASPQ